MPKTDPWRHTSRCAVCRHKSRAEIETLFREWKPQTEIAKRYGVDRQAVYRHARAFGLFEKRSNNVRSILSAVIERGGAQLARSSVSPAVTVAAAVALSKLDASGRTVDFIQNAEDKIGALLADPRWTRGEMEAFADTGVLPSWATLSD